MLFLLCLPAGAPLASGSPVMEPRFRGVCWEAGGEVKPADLARVRDLGAGWISQTPFGWQAAADRPKFHMATKNLMGFGPMWGETDEGIAVTSREARSMGMRVMLKPHLWVRGGEWCGTIRMRTAEDWREWFRSYTEFAVHYAALAEREHIETFVVGTELKGTSSRESDWRRVITAVRKVYHGQLTYSANWDGEVDSVRFWDALDFIGVQAYYPLSDKPSPTLEELKAGWTPVVQELAETSRRWGRPIVFTEVGYKSSELAAARPWEWEPQGPLDLELQSRCYEALFQSTWGEPWFRGLFLWKWHRDDRREGGPEGRGFTPQRKPAEAVARRWFRAAG